MNRYEVLAYTDHGMYAEVIDAPSPSKALKDGKKILKALVMKCSPKPIKAWRVSLA